MMNINENIRKKLYAKGYEPIGESETRKNVKKIDTNKISAVLFEIFYKNPIYRIIAQETFGEGMIHAPSAIQSIIKLDLKNLIQAPLKSITCNGCDKKILTFNKSGNPPNISDMKCSDLDCRHNKFRLEDDWQLSIKEMVEYCNFLHKNKILQRVLSPSCPNCFEISDFMEFSYKNFQKNKIKKSQISKMLFCEKCKTLNEIYLIYTLNEEISNLWQSGTWLEWYVKKILEHNKLNIEQGIKIRDRKNKKNQIEVDGLFIKDNKLFSIECKSISLDKRAEENEVKDVIKLSDFSDRIIFVTTAKIGANIKDRYTKLVEKKTDAKLIFVEGKEIENLPYILKNY